METSTSNNPRALEEIRRDNGAAQCKKAFRLAWDENEQKAIDMLNDPGMSFGTFIVLIPEMRSLGLKNQLNEKGAAALGIVDEILENPSDTEGYLAAPRDSVHSILRWMVDTADLSYTDDNYEQILDICVSILLNLYQDEEILPLVDSMIFTRAKNGRNIHYLAWAFFRVQNPRCLRLTAEHLCSSDPNESQTAYQLLRLDPSVKENQQAQYQKYISWMAENDPFLYFTEESMQFSGKPQICKVDWERKYLQKENATNGRLSSKDVTPEETTLLQQFRTLERNQRHRLADHSHQMRRRDAEQWKKWLHTAPEMQLKALSHETEV